MINIIAAIFAALGLYNLYLVSKLRVRVRLTSVDFFVFAFIIIMFAIYQWVFSANLINILTMALSILFWNFSGTIARGFSEKKVYTNKLSPFVNKARDLDDIKSVTLSREAGRLLAIIYFKDSNVEDNQRFTYKDEKEIRRILKGQKVNIIN